MQDMARPMNLVDLVCRSGSAYDSPADDFRLLELNESGLGTIALAVSIIVSHTVAVVPW